jgi:hypothetical protein
LISKKLKTFIYQIIEYQEGMQDFVEMEKMALESLILLWRQQGKNSLLLKTAVFIIGTKI